MFEKDGKLYEYDEDGYTLREVDPQAGARALGYLLISAFIFWSFIILAVVLFLFL